MLAAKAASLISILIIALMVTAGCCAAGEPHSFKPKAAQKVSTDLAALFEEYSAHQSRHGASSEKLFKPSNSRLRVAEGRVMIDAVASGEANALGADLKALKMTGISSSGRMISGYLPIVAIGALQDLDTLRFARPAYVATRPKDRGVAPVLPQGKVGSQGEPLK